MSCSSIKCESHGGEVETPGRAQCFSALQTQSMTVCWAHRTSLLNRKWVHDFSVTPSRNSY